jgi:hypothetical protein
MNYRYVPDANSTLKQVIAHKPAASLNEIRRSHPTLLSMSLDHLALRIGQLSRDHSAASLK